eukprot:2224536-Prymnesium_polylepis.1
MATSASGGVTSALDFAEDEDDGRLAFVKPRSVHLKRGGAGAGAGYDSLLNKFSDGGRKAPAAVELDVDELESDDELASAATSRKPPPSTQKTHEVLVEEMLGVRAEWVMQEEARVRRAEAMEDEEEATAAAAVGKAGSRGGTGVGAAAAGGGGGGDARLPSSVAASADDFADDGFEPSAQFAGARP